MSVRKLVDQIAEMGMVDERILQKIRREIDDPEKNVKPKGILAFLVKKDQITKSQAARLLKDLESAKKTEDEIEVAVKATPDPHDSDMLIDLNKPDEEVVDVVVDHGATRQDEVIDLDAEEHIYSPDELVEEPVTVTTVPAMPVQTQPTLPAYPDNLLNPIDPLATGFGQAEAEQPKSRESTGLSFAGKRDQNDQWATKWLYIGFGILGFLLIMLGVLYLAVGGQNLEALQEQAETSFSKGAYQDAIAKYEKLIDTAPNHEKSGLWKVRIVHAMLVDPFERDNFNEVMKVAETHLPDVADLDEFSSMREDLGTLILPNSAYEISVKATQEGSVEDMTTQLETAKRAQALVDDSRYLTGSYRKMDSVSRKLEEIQDNVRRIEHTIQKENDLTSAKKTIAELTVQARTDEAFVIFNSLVRQYGDLGARPDLRDLMKQVSAKEVERVTPAGLQLVGQKEEIEGVIVSQVVVARRQGNGVNSLKGEVIPVLTDGVLYGLDAGDGTIRWNRFPRIRNTLRRKVGRFGKS